MGPSGDVTTTEAVLPLTSRDRSADPRSRPSVGAVAATVAQRTRRPQSMRSSAQQLDQRVVTM